MKVLLTDKYTKGHIEKIRELGYEIVERSEKTVLNDDETNAVDVLVTYNPFDTLDISKMSKLKYIQLTSVGIDQLPKKHVIDKKILISNNKGGYSIPIGEWIVMYILNIYKETHKLYKQQMERKWKMSFSIEELSDKKVGFIGTGTIAIEAAKRLKPFGVELLGVNTNGEENNNFNQCFSKDKIDIIFKECDVVVITVPSTKETINLVDKNKFEMMKQNSVFINVGRGNIVDEEALINNISKFKGVALDVFNSEPLKEESNLWEHDNITLTPHNSWVSNKNNERTFNTIYNNLKNYINRKEIINKVDIKRGY